MRHPVQKPWRRIGLLLSACVTVLVVSPLSAQPAESKASAAELRERLAELDRLIEAERAAKKTLQETREAALAAERERRAELAAELLELRLGLESDGARIDALRSENQTLERQADRWETDARAVHGAIASALERLRIALSEAPGWRAAAERLESAAQSLAKQAEPASPEALVALKTLAEELGAAHAAARSVAVRPATLYTALGEREAVRLLSVGLVRFAYVTDAGDRVGVALPSPSDASGYRWSEALDEPSAAAVREAVQAVEAGRTAVVSVPMDPTGRVQGDTLAAQEGLEDRLKAGGPVMIPLGGVALFALLLIFERFWVLYGRNRFGTDVARRTLAVCRAGQYDEARDICAQAQGAVARVLAACLSRRSLGQRAMEDSIQEQLLQELPRLNRFMGGMAILAAVAPLLGLLGTVTGIIETFGVVRAFGNANPSLMAAGISEALITTATGLSIAIPILIMHSLLRGRADRVIADAERHAATVLTALSHDVGAANGAAGAVEPSAPNPEPALQEADVA